MKNRDCRIIIDTNLWISFLISKEFEKLDSLLLTQKCTLLFSRELIDEFLEVVERPKLRKYFDSEDVENLLTVIHEIAEFVDVSSNIIFLKDSKDDFLLSLAKDGKADYLITGDKELLNVEKFGSTEIMTMTDFLKLAENKV